MTRWLCGALVLTLTVVLAGTAGGQKDPSIKEIMTKAHKGPNSLIQKVGKDLKAASPDWAEVQQMTKELVSLGTSLGKNDPPKGGKDSWEKLTKAYVKTATALNAAAQKKDKGAAVAAQKKLTGMCGACHKLHK